MIFRICIAAAALLCASTYSHAAVTQQDQQTTIKADTSTLIMEANKGRGRGGDKGGKGRGRGGGKVNSTDDNSNDSGSGRRKPRVPGGSGCDSARDLAEHASCGG
jgi:hypothetical protein